MRLRPRRNYVVVLVRELTGGFLDSKVGEPASLWKPRSTVETKSQGKLFSIQGRALSTQIATWKYL